MIIDRKNYNSFSYLMIAAKIISSGIKMVFKRGVLKQVKGAYPFDLSGNFPQMKFDSSGAALCDLCHDCVDICPTNALSLIEEGTKVLNLDYKRCISCQDCIEVCHVNALELSRTARAFHSEQSSIDNLLNDSTEK